MEHYTSNQRLIDMPKVSTTYVDGYYYPRVLSEREQLDYEELGFKIADVPQDVMDKWDQHRTQVEYWHKFWRDIDRALDDE